MSRLFHAAVAIAVLWAGPMLAQTPTEWRPDLSAPMQFHMASTGGNCLTCRFISAQGIITRKTPEEFIKFIDNNGLNDLSSTNIHLNSPGGHLDAALEFGRIIRETGAGTVVAESAGFLGDWGIDDRFLDSDQPSCLSACVFAFVGGTTRYAIQGEGSEYTGFQKTGPLGVHQFASHSGARATTQDALALQSADQSRISGLMGYVSDMDVSADLLVLMLRTPNTQMRLLTNDEVRDLRLHNAGGAADVRLVGYPNGVGIVETRSRSQFAETRLELFCDAQGRLGLQASVSWTGVNWQGPADENLLRFFQTLYTANAPLRLMKQDHTQTGSGPVQSVVLYAVPDATARDHAFRNGVDFENATWSWFDKYADGLDTWLGEPFDGFDVLPRLCLT